jgi:hypothetical protein
LRSRYASAPCGNTLACPQERGRESARGRRVLHVKGNFAHMCLPRFERRPDEAVVLCCLRMPMRACQPWLCSHVSLSLSRSFSLSLSVARSLARSLSRSLSLSLSLSRALSLLLLCMPAEAKLQTLTDTPDKHQRPTIMEYRLLLINSLSRARARSQTHPAAV